MKQAIRWEHHILSRMGKAKLVVSWIIAMADIQLVTAHLCFILFIMLVHLMPYAQQ
jgi:hypothetical protein